MAADFILVNTAYVVYFALEGEFHPKQFRVSFTHDLIPYRFVLDGEPSGCVWIVPGTHHEQ